MANDGGCGVKTLTLPRLHRWEVEAGPPRTSDGKVLDLPLYFSDPGNGLEFTMTLNELEGVVDHFKGEIAKHEEILRRS